MGGDLCGVEVVPLTLQRLALLDAARNPFLFGGAITPEAVAQFLWVLAPDFRIGDTERRAVFVAALRASDALEDLPECARQIGEFLDEMMLDAPAASGGGSARSAITSQEAVYCHLFGEAYGWDDAKTMNTPLPRLYQILRRITLSRDPEAKFINRRSDKVRGDWQRAQQAQGAAL